MKKYMTIGNMFGRTVKTACRGGLLSFAFSLFHLFTLSLLVSSCSMIDEDQSDCNYTKVEYDLTLVTNITTEIQTQLETQLNTQLEMELGVLLKDFLSNIFTDYAHDVNLSFYDTHGDSLRLQHDEHIMDANQASYTLNLPMREYMHLAVANLVDNDLVDLVDDDRCHRSVLFQDQPDTIPSHTTGLFTARQKMEVLEGIDQNFKVHLYMAHLSSTPRAMISVACRSIPRVLPQGSSSVTAPSLIPAGRPSYAPRRLPSRKILRQWLSAQ